MIFEDPSKRRWKLTLRISMLIIGIAAIFFSLYIYSSVVYPPIPSLSKLNKEVISKDQVKNSAKNSKNKSLPKFSNDSFVRSAFISQNDAKSIDEMKKHIDDLDMVFPDWFTFTGEKDKIDKNIDSSLLDYLKKSNVMILPRIANNDNSGNWLGANFTNYISSAEKRTLLCSLILKSLKEYNLKGINLDFESIDPTSKSDYLDFLIELKELLHKNNMYLTVDLPPNNEAFDYELIGKLADNVVIMAYDYNYPSGENGPIADQNWFTNEISDVLTKIPKEKTIIAMGQYSYDWNITKKTAAKSLKFDEAMALARDFGVNIETDKQSINSTFSYKESNGDYHKVWMLDGISLWNEMQFLKSKHVYGISLWRIGSEDPTIWDFYPKENFGSVKPNALENIRTSNSSNYDGNGELLKVQAVPHEGKREIAVHDNLIDYAKYTILPTSYEVQRLGRSDKLNIALTFDDGPDPSYTTEILDVLKKYNISATFFVTGDQVQKFPEIIKREVKEGHIIGNHTYYHPDITKISDNRLKLELNSTQRLIRAITGKDTVLFRSPYDTDSSPIESEQLNPLYTANQMGYTVVNADIDSKDYENPGVNVIVNSVVKQLNQKGSNIILMHDAGGNRSQTVAALDKLIPLLKNKGYKFVKVNDLLGVSQKNIMPDLGLREKIIGVYDNFSGAMKKFGWQLIVILFAASTIISILRILFLGFFVLKSKKNQRIYDNKEDFQPFVSIIIPAYNEEKVIGKTLQGVLQSNYTNFEILVVDDGSKDNTRKVAKEFAMGNPKVRVITKPNEGKFSALNLGFSKAKGEYVITIDADTIILPNTIGNLVAPFIDTKVDAVCGNVKVGNVNNIITGFQAVEYITTQNYDRRAFDALNCISVVPGATGAWKRDKVLGIGGYSDLTLTEDADLTLTMLENGDRIIYAPDAISITEAPENVKDLFKQRFRWSFGTYQCLWKHRKSFFKGSLGWIALPNMFLFQLILPILSPIGDLVFLTSIFRGDMKSILAGYLLFLLMDLLGSLIAFTIDKAPYKHMWLILIQRFYYRQIMYFITFKAIIASLKGRSHGWNKLNRTSSVNINNIVSNDIDSSEKAS